MNTSKSIAIIGANGLLGNDLKQYLSDNYEVTGITKENYNSYCGHKFDLIINANGNSKRFWANIHPLEDFITSTVSVYKSIFDFFHKTYIYISSSDVYEKHYNPVSTSENQEINSDKLSSYGFNKYLAERIVRRHSDSYLILRSSMILGSNLRKGPVYDILNNKDLFISKKSKLQLITTNEISRIISRLIGSKSRNEIFNLGGTGVFSFANAGKYFKQKIHFRKDAQLQQYEMNVSKLNRIYPLKSSEDYLLEYLQDY